MRHFVKTILFSLSTAIIAVPAMAASPHQDSAHRVAPHQVAHHNVHKQSAKHAPKIVMKKKHHANPHHLTKHDVKHR